MKKKKNIEKKKKDTRKKGKEGPKKRPRQAQKLIFHIRIVKRNRNEIEARKKSNF